MFTIGKYKFEKPLLLAPMEDVTNMAFRMLCKEFGADIVYTEFINSEGVKRKDKRTLNKGLISEKERPVGIQLYGNNLGSMVESAKIIEEFQPDIIDINAGCWVRKVANRGAGAGLLKDPPYLQKLVGDVVKAVGLPVTVKTRIGWDAESIHIVEIAKRLEDVGVKALTVHCRTRAQGHSGEPQWDWINKVKESVKIPVILNGGVLTPQDALNAFNQTGADGVMIARGAIGNPWIFKQARELIETGGIKTKVTPEFRIQTILKHLKMEIEARGNEFATIPFRKFYSGYLKGLRGNAKVRQTLMRFKEYKPIEETLLSYLDELKKYDAED